MGFSFPLGILLYRAYRTGRVFRPSSTGAWLPIAALALAVVLPVHGPLSGLTDALLIMGVFPLLITAAALGRVEARGAAICAKLGAISFPLYALHGPFVALSLFGAGLMGLAGSSTIAAVAATSLLIGLGLVPNRILTGPGHRRAEGSPTPQADPSRIPGPASSGA